MTTKTWLVTGSSRAPGRTTPGAVFFGVVDLMRAAVPVKRHQRSGRIIKIPAAAGRVGMAGQSACWAAKFAVNGLTESVARELAALGVRVIVVGAAAIVLAACGRTESAPQKHAPEVGVVTVQPQSVPVVTELPGRTSAFLVAQVRARVDGIVLKREFTEGSEVKAGQRLYQIDPAPYIASLNNAKATLAKAQANLATQNALVARYKVLVAANAVSNQDYDNAVAAQGQAAADVAAGKAAVQTAQINLGYTDVTSPITGRIGISQVTPGAYVQAGQATLMSTVQQIDPVYVDLTQSSIEGLKLRQDVQSGRVKTSGPGAAKVTLILEDGKPYLTEGSLQFTDVTVDQTTGSVTIRAISPIRSACCCRGCSCARGLRKALATTRSSFRRSV